MAGVEHDGIGRLSERRGLAAAVNLVAVGEVPGDVVGGNFRPPPCELLLTALGAGGEIGLEKYFHFGFRTDHGADIASHHHHALLPGQALLQGKQSGTRFRLRRHLRHIRVNCGRTDRPGDVFSAEQERELAAIGGSCLLARRLPGTVGGTNADIQRACEHSQRGSIFHGHLPAQGSQGQDAVENACIYEEVAEPGGEEAAQGALARSGSTVDGDREARFSSWSRLRVPTTSLP